MIMLNNNSLSTQLPRERWRERFSANSFQNYCKESTVDAIYTNRGVGSVASNFACMSKVESLCNSYRKHRYPLRVH